MAVFERPLRIALDAKMNVAEGCEAGLEHIRELENVVQDQQEAGVLRQQKAHRR